MSRRSRAKPASPFRCFNSSPEVIRLVVMMYVRYPLSLRNVEDLLFERGIDLCHETIRFWWNRFGPMFAGEVRRQRVSRMRGFRQWRWHLDEVYVKIGGEMHYLWRAVDHEGEILESFVTKTRDKQAALTFMKKSLKRHGSPEAITTDGLTSYKAAMKQLGNSDKQHVGRWANNRVENSHLPFRRRERAMLRFRQRLHGSNGTSRLVLALSERQAGGAVVWEGCRLNGRFPPDLTKVAASAHSRSQPKRFANTASGHFRTDF